jgi:uncharacterized OB-fold protein
VTDAKKGEQAKIRPRIGRWEVGADGSVTLLGSRCRRCGETFFPSYEVCGRCASEKLDEVRLSGPARLTAWTTVHQLPAGFAGTMAVGYGELEGPVLVLAPIDAPPETLAAGMLLDLYEDVTWTDGDGEPMRSYRYRPAAG